MKGERGGRSAAWQRRRGRAPEGDAARSSARPQPAWECEPRSAGAPRDGAVGKPSSTDYCRLCHGKFSSRSLRHAFGKFPVLGRSSEKQRRLDQVFYMDFQQLLGVSVRCDPELPRFVCKDCHAQFYKCRSVLKTFIQRVNTSPTKPHASRADGKIHNEANCTTAACADLITSSSECLLGLVGWTHKHAGICQSMPGLQQLLSAQYCGVIRAVWACKGGHDYIMEMDSDSSAPSTQQEQDRLTLGSGNGAHCVNAESAHVPSVYSLPDIVVVGSFPPLSQSPAIPMDIPASQNDVLDPDPSLVHRSTEDAAGDDGSSLSDGDFQSKEVGEGQGDLSSSDEYIEALPEKSRRIPQKRKGARSRRKSPSESRQRKKPGPKPGWNKIKPEREELPPIFKCPYQGCTAVYRGADGMKKHVKEQHEEMRERPCPHPGCNKVFLIDRYLQRHVKLIHTEQRNYICDQCGQAFKQRKHLSVHQMRHSGAKPLQCEVCGFQCRQRASLKYHMTKHKAEADLEFACDQCGKRFEKAHNLNVHMSMVHPLVQIPSNELVTEPRVPDSATEERAQTGTCQEPPP